MNVIRNGLVKLTKADIPRATQVLGKAFATEPLAVTYFPEDERKLISETFSAMALYLCMKYGEVYTTSSDFEGVAAWCPPGTAPFSGWQSLRAIPLRVLFRFGRQGAARLQPMGGYVDSLHKRIITAPHWYLQIIGVDPVHQGKGISSRLVRPMLERIDAEDLPVYLETQTKKNVGIYERFGFKVIHEGTLPESELPVIGMLRQSFSEREKKPA